jgi:hypothetical protein
MRASQQREITKELKINETKYLTRMIENDEAYTTEYGQAVSSKAIFEQTPILTGNSRSGAVVNKIDPSLQSDPPLPP